jgi:hypothetical protein
LSPANALAAADDVCLSEKGQGASGLMASFAQVFAAIGSAGPASSSPGFPAIDWQVRSSVQQY